MKRRHFKFIEREHIGGATWYFKFESPDEITARPGQFFIFHWNDRLQRSYSIGNVIKSPSRIYEFFVALVDNGLGSEFLRQLEPGNTVEVAGPTGRFAVRNFELPHVLVGTGTGIAPFYSAMPDIEKLRDNGCAVRLISGARTKQELLFDEIWRTADIDYSPCVSRTPEEGCTHGRVQAALFETPIDLGAVYMLCGNPDMIVDVKKRLQDAGVPRVQIRTESYT